MNFRLSSFVGGTLMPATKSREATRSIGRGRRSHVVGHQRDPLLDSNRRSRLDGPWGNGDYHSDPRVDTSGVAVTAILGLPQRITAVRRGSLQSLVRDYWVTIEHIAPGRIEAGTGSSRNLFDMGTTSVGPRTFTEVKCSAESWSCFIQKASEWWSYHTKPHEN
jgi:hypothetical protein